MIKKNPTKPALLAAIIFYSFLSFGQTSPNDNEYDKKYVPNQNSIFNNLVKKNNESSSSSTDIEIKNSIKFYPTMAARQKIFFSYTADLGKGFCLEAGIGKAFGNDYLQSVYFAIFDDINSDTPLSVAKMFSNSTYSSSFPLLSIGAKIYFSGKTFDGGYIDFLYRYEKMTYQLDPSIDNVYRVDGPGLASFAMNAAYFGFGYTVVTGEKNNFTHDFFISFGLKSFKYTQFVAVQIPIAGTGSSEQIYRASGIESTVRILPAINMGYAFGFGF